MTVKSKTLHSQDELRDLAVRTCQLERQVHAIQHTGERAVLPSVATHEMPHERTAGFVRPLRVGDRVRFKATKVTPGGSGRPAL